MSPRSVSFNVKRGGFYFLLDTFSLLVVQTGGNM